MKKLGHKSKILMDKLSLMGKKLVKKAFYSLSISAKAFKYFISSRFLYKLVDDYSLPRAHILTRITSKINKLQDI